MEVIQNIKLKLVFFLFLPLLQKCHRVKQEKQNNNISKKYFQKKPKIRDTCWIFIEDKKFFIGEDSSDIGRTIEIHQSPVGEWDVDYESFLDDVKLSKIALIRMVFWQLRNNKLQSVYYQITTTDTYLSENADNHFSEKNFQDYHKYINAVKSKNKCISRIETGSDSSQYKRSIIFMWK